jgi:hypothetical protein
MTDDELATKYADEIAAYKARPRGRLQRLCDKINTATGAVEGDPGAARGYHQPVTVGGDAHRRVTATRLVATGVFAFAFKKRAGHVYLDTYTPDGVLVSSEEHKLKDERKLRERAAKFNRNHQ